MRVAPADLLEDGFADAMVPGTPVELAGTLAAALDELRSIDPPPSSHLVKVLR